jgi:hypothetical protein
MRELVEDQGGDPHAFQIAYPLVNAFGPAGEVDYAAMFAEVPWLAEAGVTDFRTLLRVPRDYAAARMMLTELAESVAAAC